MSGSYMNAAQAATAAANATNSAPLRSSRRSAERSGGVAPCHSASSTSCSSSTAMSSATAGATFVKMRPASSRTAAQQRRHHQHHQHHQQQRPRSVISQRFSQVYDIAVHGRPAFLHRAAVTPALWLLCQTVLVVLFALCCAFLINRQADLPRNPWIRLEFMRRIGEENTYKTAANKAFGELVCSNSTDALGSRHCEDMRGYFELRTTSNETAVIIRKGTVYRINAAVTFRQVNPGLIGRPVDVSVNIDKEAWISCQEGISGTYIHCSLFGMRYLPVGSAVTFSSSRSEWQIASHSGTTFFDIEMR